MCLSLKAVVGTHYASVVGFEQPIIFTSRVHVEGKSSVCVICMKYRILIDDFRGACAVKGNVQVAGHVKRVDHGDAFNARRYVKKR